MRPIVEASERLHGAPLPIAMAKSDSVADWAPSSAWRRRGRGRPARSGGGPAGAGAEAGRTSGRRCDNFETTSAADGERVRNGAGVGEPLSQRGWRAKGQRLRLGPIANAKRSGEGTGIGESVSQRGSTAKEQGLRLGRIANVKRCGKVTDIGESVSQRGGTGTEGKGARVAVGPKCQREEEWKRHGQW